MLELEEIVGERLLERSRTGVYLTAPGEVLHRYASVSLTALRQGLDLLAHTRKDSQRAILIGVLPNVAAEVMPRVVSNFKQTFPESILAISTGTNSNLLTALRAGEIDVVIGRLAESKEMVGLHFERIYTETLVLVSQPRHPFFNKKKYNIESITEYIVILPLRNTIIRAVAEQFFISQGISDIPKSIETVSTAFGKSFVKQSNAIWIVPYGVVADDIRKGHLSQIPINMKTTEGPVGISTRIEGSLPPRTSFLISEIRKVM